MRSGSASSWSTVFSCGAGGFRGLRRRLAARQAASASARAAPAPATVAPAAPAAPAPRALSDAGAIGKVVQMDAVWFIFEGLNYSKPYNTLKCVHFSVAAKDSMLEET